MWGKGGGEISVGRGNGFLGGTGAVVTAVD